MQPSPNEPQASRTHSGGASTAETRPPLAHPPCGSSPILVEASPQARHGAPQWPAWPVGEGYSSSHLRFVSRPSRSNIERLFRQLEAEAAQVFLTDPAGSPPARAPASGEGDKRRGALHTSRSEGCGNTTALYQALFLHALGDSAAWERRARTLEAAAQAHAKREAHLAQQLHRARQELALLAAYMGESERVAAVARREGGTAPVLPPRHPMHTHTSAAEALSNSGARGGASAEQNGNGVPVTESPQPRRLPSRSAVSDLLRGSLGRSLELAYGSSISSADREGVNANAPPHGIDAYFCGLTPTAEGVVDGSFLVATDLEDAESEASAEDRNSAHPSHAAVAALPTPSPMPPHAARPKPRGTPQQLRSCCPTCPPNQSRSISSCSSSLLEDIAMNVYPLISSAVAVSEVGQRAHTTTTTTATQAIVPDTVASRTSAVKPQAQAANAPASPFIPAPSEDSPSAAALPANKVKPFATDAEPRRAPPYSPASSPQRGPAAAAQHLLALMRSRDASLSAERQPSPNTKHDEVSVIGSCVADTAAVSSNTDQLVPSSALTPTERLPHRPRMSTHPPIASHSHSVDYEVTVNDGLPQPTARRSASSVESAAAASTSSSAALRTTPTASSITPHTCEQGVYTSTRAPIVAAELLRDLNTNASSSSFPSPTLARTSSAERGKAWPEVGERSTGGQHDEGSSSTSEEWESVDASSATENTDDGGQQRLV
ncbi:hypothetical protein ABB37_02318 [Leptomonas pyrrhocoris]|uniref:Uncharacterized protein n=1 Tax=Leptomonas pyrrhocoris TaxID=157538 RepID=A0A0M9G7Z8_LEPPY|nr:hypothetical protein ABB37_02318 [Leptomonas pyrrhocoris]KPA84296.1 hypothetical protein ABB37_02318 [Leptomonas pyrrhocoris]|eukprot:XP_015662735.1 hypothetical protein ABB37_02318 [Leptomonas pyrrhocoris]